MRKLFLALVLIFIVGSISAQEQLGENFIKKDNTIIWQKVYEYPESDSILVKNHFYKNNKFAYNGEIGSVYPTLKEYSSFEFSQRPSYFNDRSKICFIVQIKKNRYRVTVQTIDPLDTFIQGNRSKSNEDAKYLNDFLASYIKRNGDIKTVFLNSYHAINEALSNLFEYKSKLVLDDDF